MGRSEALPPEAALAARLETESHSGMGQMLARIEAMLKASSSFEEFREMLLASSDDIDAAELKAVLANAMLAGETGGRAMIEEEADG